MNGVVRASVKNRRLVMGHILCPEAIWKQDDTVSIRAP